MWKYPIHGLEQWEQVILFYNSLTSKYRWMFDYATLGGLLNKNALKAFEIIQVKALKDHRQCLEETMRRNIAHGVDLTPKIDAMSDKFDVMSNQFSKILSMSHPMNMVQACFFCGGPHRSEERQGGGATSSSQPSIEELDYISNNPSHNNPYSNSYNPGWRNHPNFGWRNNDQIQQQRQAASSSQPQHQR